MLGVLTKLFSSKADEPEACGYGRGTENTGVEPERQQRCPNDGGDAGTSNSSASPQWLSYYAKIAPQEISRWVNPNDGSGSITYEQLVENLNMFNIPVLPMKPFASPEHFNPRSLTDRDKTTAGSPHEFPPLAVSSGVAPALATHRIQQEVVSNSMNRRSSGWTALPGTRNFDANTLLPAVFCEEQCPTAAKDFRDHPAAGHCAAESHSQELSDSYDHTGIRLRASVGGRRADDFQGPVGEWAPATARPTPEAPPAPEIEQALRVPVTATQAMYVGPVREFRGALSGVVDGGATRPGPHSQVPPTYVKILNSEVRVHYDTEKHALETAQWPTVIPSKGVGDSELGAGGPVSGSVAPLGTQSLIDSPTGEAPASSAANGDTAEFCKDNPPPPRLFHKPPPIFLAPLIKGTEKDCRYPAANRVWRQDADSEGVTFSLGQYVWTEEDAKLGTVRQGRSDLQECIEKICPGAILPAVFQPESRSADNTRVTTKDREVGHTGDSHISPVNIEDLGMPSVVELCEEMKAKLTQLSGSILERICDDVQKGETERKVDRLMRSNKGGIGGLRAAKCAKKATVVFVEVPMLKAEMTPEGLWRVFRGLTEEQKTCLAMLDGCAADLSDDEALHCALYCRSLKAARQTGAFQDFFGKMKMNAHALRGGEGWALYPHAARIKHSCDPNVAYRNIDGLLVFFALRDIPEGSPITMSYIDQLYMPTEERRKLMLARKRLLCECTRCLNPMQEERKILCPQCRPTKLCFVGEKPEHPTVDNSGNVAVAVQRKSIDNAGYAALRQQMNFAQEVGPDAHQNRMKDMPELMPSTQARAELAGECANKHIKDDHCDSTYEKETNDATTTYADASLSSVCSETDREDNRQGICDKLCIVSTAIGTKREDTCANKTVDDGESGDADGDISDSDASWRQQQDSICKNSDCTGEISKHIEGVSHDDENVFEITSEALCASFSDAFTSADSNGNCSSSEFSDEEQERTAKVVADTPAAEDQRRPTLDEEKGSSDVLTKDESAAGTRAGIYCVYEGQGCWRCGACGRQFTDNDMPVGFENYLIGYYTALRERLGRPTPEAWNTECGQLIRTVEKVLGAEHWLYLAGHLMVTQLYLGMWIGGLVVDVILTHALRHAALVVSSVVKPAFSAARQLDIAPLMTAVLRILLFNGRSREFVEWVEERGALKVIREIFGTYDEVYISFSTAYAYVRQKIDEGSEPSLGLLHRFAHASQRTIAQDAAFYEKKEAENREKAARIRAAAAEETLTRQETHRQRRIQSLRRKIAALKASAVSVKPKQIQEVTLTSPESVVGKYLRKYAAPGASAHNITEALQQEFRGSHRKDISSTETSSNAYLMAAAAYEQAKRIQQMAIEGRFPAGLSSSGVAPEKDYLPLIMLADPLETSAQQLRVAHASADAVKRERMRYEELKQALCSTMNENGLVLQDSISAKHYEKDGGCNVACDAPTQTSGTDKEKHLVYRIPGLSGTAPGEFVTISQINHTKDGSYPPIPFFRTFFYVDHEARNVARGAAEGEESALNIRVVGCGAEGVAALSKEELDDLEAARHNFLHQEAERVDSEARATLVFEMGRRAQEAAAAVHSTKALEGGKGRSDEVINRAVPVDIIQEVNKAVRDVVIRDAHAVQRVEQFRESGTSEDVDECENGWRRREKEGDRKEKGESFVQRVAEPPGSHGISVQPPLAGAPTLATGHDATALPLSELAASKRRLRMKCELKNVPECFVGPPAVHESVKLESFEQLPYEGDSKTTMARDQRTEYGLESTGYAHRFLKPLDFSHVPPPPVVPARARFPMVALHSQYKLARDIGRTACQQSHLPPARPVVGGGRKATIPIPLVPPVRTPETPSGLKGESCNMLTHCANTQGLV